MSRPAPVLTHLSYGAGALGRLDQADNPTFVRSRTDLRAEAESGWTADPGGDESPPDKEESEGCRRDDEERHGHAAPGHGAKQQAEHRGRQPDGEPFLEPGGTQEAARDERPEEPGDQERPGGGGDPAGGEPLAVARAADHGEHDDEYEVEAGPHPGAHAATIQAGVRQ